MRLSPRKPPEVNKSAIPCVVMFSSELMWVTLCSVFPDSVNVAAERQFEPRLVEEGKRECLLFHLSLSVPPP